MIELGNKINELEKRIKRFKCLNKHISNENYQYFSNFISKVNKLNENILGYSKKNIFSKINSDIPNSYIQY